MGAKSKPLDVTRSKLKSSDFVHLHNHTHHSLLDGLTKIPGLVKKTVELGMEAVAITDHGTISGAIEFYKAAKDGGVKPIIGIEAYIAARSRHDRDPQKDKARYHLTILAMNDKGYRNLMRLVSISELEGKYYKPRMDHEILEKYNEGLIVLSGCAGSELGENLQVDNYDKAKQIAEWYRSVFGDRYYLELQDHGHPDSPDHWDVQNKVNEYLLKLSKDLDIPAVVTCDAHYLNLEDKEAHEILLCVQTGSFLSDTDRMSMKDFQLHVTDPRDIIGRWGEEHPEVITNTLAVANRCNVEIKLGEMLIPKFDTPGGETEEDYLRKLVWQGLAWRYGGVDEQKATTMAVEEAKKKLSKEVVERAEFELKTIRESGYNGYFLIVWDFIKWGKDRGIVFGPGRGSAAGSIVAYSLKITEADPIHHELMFERFLNPHRISPPDVDVDIQDTRRDEVIQYCIDKYGKDRVANIVTFGTMAARAAVRDVARVLQVPYAEADRIAKLIPPPSQGRHIPLRVCVEQDADLKREYDTNPVARQVIDFASRLEGTIRSHGVHAAGVVIAPDDIVKFIPLEMAQKGVVATQYPMGPVEDLGLLKVDFLGLSNLTIIKNTIRIVKKVHETDIELNDIPFDDAKTFQLLRRADTTGVFQIESAGMKRYLKELKPNRFEDIVAMVALYRPGPLPEIPRYIKGKNDPKSVSFLHPSLEPILRPTYGVMVYQEQIIMLLQLVAGYSAGEADLVRKAIGKKKRDIMAAEEPKFIEGCKQQGLTQSQAEKLWQQIQPFADYSFNKAHATCYGTIAYWTAYLKAHYPEAFMAALMTSDQDNIDRLAIEIAECKHMGIEVLPPDVNEGFVEFAVVPGKKAIRFGMAAVKGVGVGAVEEALRAREDGKFTSIEDFAKRVKVGSFNKKAWESLIKTGGFDSLGDRSDLLFNLDIIQAFASKVQKDALSSQTGLFDGIEDASSKLTINLQPAPVKSTDKERLVWERELLGLYISAHPLDSYEAYLAEQTVSLDQVVAEMDGKNITAGGIISTIRVIVTKGGKRMAFIRLEDKGGEIEVIVFPNLYEKIGERLLQDVIIKVDGKISSRDKEGNSNGDAKITADNIQFVTEQDLDGVGTGVNKKPNIPKIVPHKPTNVSVATPVPVAVSVPVTPMDQKLYIRVKDPDDHKALLTLKRSCAKHPGLSDVILVLGDQKQSAIRLPFKIEPSDELISILVKTLGEDSVILK